MLTAKGTYKNPVTRPCFVGCVSCHRCEKRGSSACPLPNGCSGRPDIEGMRVPHPDDLCRCKQGTMQWVTKRGQLIQRKFQSSPFESEVITDARSQDDEEWQSYLAEKRERMNDPGWDPIRFTDGTSATQWEKAYRDGNR